jgi:hypothetical protein
MKVRLNEIELKHIIEESVKRLLKEYYRGPIYHATNIYGLYHMSLSNTLETSDDSRGDDGYKEKRHVNYADFICFTRDKNFNIARDREQVSAILTFDTEKLMKIRNGRLYPVNWGNCKNSNNNGYNEAEERFYIDKIYPLSEYVEKIEILIKENEISNDSSLADYASEGFRDGDDYIYNTFEEFSEKYEDEEELYKNFNMYFINLILKSLLGNKVSIINI